MDSGTVTYSVPKGTYADKLISFNKAFSVIPEIKAMMYIDGGYIQTHSIYDITRSGFRIKCTTQFSSSYNTTVEWNANAPIA